MLLQKLKIDDPVDASPVHGFCGIWGVLAAALFDWGSGFNHYHGWSAWDCMDNEGNGSCSSGLNALGLGVNALMVGVVPWLLYTGFLT